MCGVKDKTMSSRKVLPNPEANLHLKQVHMLKLLNIHLNHFPKHEKYGLCQQIRNTAYDMYNITTICQKRYYNKSTLRDLDVKHEQLRMLLKLAFDLGYYKYKDSKSSLGDKEAFRRYSAISVFIDDIGSMIGGWIKVNN